MLTLWIKLGCLLGLAAATSFSQIDTGSIAGTVRDPSGAVIAGAAVTIRNQDTGIETRTQSNELGQYVSPPLRPSPYSVSVEKAGFRRAVSELTLTIGQRAVVEFGLVVGAVEEQIVVEGGAPLLETESSTVGNLRDEDAVKNLPLNTRNFNQLIGLAAGVVPAQTQSSGLALTATRGTTANSVNGIGFRANNYRVDGLDNAENHNGQGILIYPPVEAIQEFRVNTSVANAEFGRGGGGSINVTYKSGAKGLHGSLFEFLRNSALDAKNFFDGPGKIAPLRMSQYGATVGGPVLLPFGYNRAREKTFFFFSYEGEERRQALTYLVALPLPAMKQGDFSAHPNQDLRSADHAAGAHRHQSCSRSIPGEDRPGQPPRPGGQEPDQSLSRPEPAWSGVKLRVEPRSARDAEQL